MTKSNCAKPIYTQQQKFGILVLADYKLAIGDSRAIYFISIGRMAIQISIIQISDYCCLRYESESRV